MFFSDSDIGGYYDSGLAFATPPSQIQQAGTTGDKIPTTTQALVDKNALRISWTSATGGDWSALAIPPGFVFRNLSTADSLGFWVYSPQVLAKADLPDIFLEGAPANMKSARYSLGDYLPNGLQANRWTQVSIALDRFRTDPANASLLFNQIKAVIFGQGRADGQPHSIYVDQIEAYSIRTQASGSVPAQFSIRDFPMHRELRFVPAIDAPDYLAVLSNGNLHRLLSNARDTLYMDWPENRDAATYTLNTFTPGFGFGDTGITATANALPEATDDALLDMTQEYTLRYFWDFRHPTSGLARERNTSGNTVTMGGSGFGIMAWLVGIERGWLTREEVRDQLLTTLTFLEQADRFHGVWPHWMDGRNGNTIPFSANDDGGDLVETAFLAQGLLTVRQYFHGDTPAEDSIRQKATRLWEDIEWDWYQRPGENVLTWHWSPTNQWAINLKIRGFNEAQIIYMLAVASPTHPISPSVYQTGWVTPNYRNFSGRNGVIIPVGDRSGGPMFFAHYSYQGFDPRYWKDQFTNYFVRNQRHVAYQVAYAVENPENHVGYSANNWGFTASDDPLVGYLAHEAAEAFDNGTITPTAALASMPYDPVECMRALRTFYEVYGEQLLGPLGFYDAFNLNLDWFATSTLAIDQGPIVTMIENHRSGLLWDVFMRNPEIEPMLLSIGFTPDSTSVSSTFSAGDQPNLRLFPNPATGFVTLDLPEEVASTTSQLEILDGLGRIAFRQNLQQPGLRHVLDVSTWPAGVYCVKLSTKTGQWNGQLVRHE